MYLFFFFQAEDGIRDKLVTGVQTCALPILVAEARPDVVISLRQAAAGEKRGRLAWFGLQYTLDVADLLDGGGETTCDGIGLHTQYWRDRTTDCLRIKAYHRSRTQRAKAEPVDDAAA